MRERGRIAQTDLICPLDERDFVGRHFQWCLLVKRFIRPDMEILALQEKAGG